MDAYRSLDPESLIGKIVVFRGTGEAVEIEKVINGEFIGKSLLSGGDRTQVDCGFIEDGMIVLSKEEARQIFAPVLAIVEKYFSPEPAEEEEEQAAEAEAVGV